MELFAILPSLLHSLKVDWKVKLGAILAILGCIATAAFLTIALATDNHMFLFGLFGFPIAVTGMLMIPEEYLL